jgi:putative transposase
MARRPRIVIPGWVHHVTQRGNHQQNVFFSAHDRIVYLQLIEKYFPKWGLQLIGHNLMDNHIHLAVIPEKKYSLCNGVAQLHHDFALWQNIQHHRTGHLWQNRFYSCPVEEDRIWEVLGYIELNPVRARMVEHAWEWEWSSAQAHVTGLDTSGLLNMGFWQKAFTPTGWKEYLESMMQAEGSRAATIRNVTMRGLFLGSDATALRLEREMGIHLLPGKRGRRFQLRAVLPELPELGQI